jgi:hypothetical protein
VKRIANLVLGLLLWVSPTVLAEPPEGAAAEAARPSARSDRVPRAYGVTLGGAYAFRSRLPLGQGDGAQHPRGLLLSGGLGWQVRGLAGGAPATIGFETNFLYQPARDARTSYGVIYGVFAKHSFLPQLRVRPYFAYGLGAGQMWISDVEGRGIGHATRISLGVDTRLRQQLHWTLALTYQGLIMPRFTLGSDGVSNTSFHSLVLSTGLWFGQ